MGKKKHIDEFFREKLYNNEFKPSGDIWDKIDAELHPDLFTVETKPTKNYAKYIAVSLLCLIIILFTIFKSQKQYSAEQFSLEATQFQIQYPDQSIQNPTLKLEDLQNSTATISENKPVSDVVISQSQKHEENFSEIETFNSSTQQPKHIDITSNSETSDYINNNNESSFTEIVIIDHSEEAKPITINPEINKTELSNSLKEVSNPALVSIKENTSKLLNSTQNKNLNLKESNSNFQNSNQPNIHLKGLSFGVAASFYETSLLDYGNIFKEDKPIQPSLRFGISKGISANYNFSNKFGVGVDYIYNAVLGQNYELDQNDEIINKSLALYYNQIPVTFKLKVPKISDITNKPIVTNYLAGFQYSMLTEYRIPQEKRLGDPENLFKESALAFILGIDYDIYLNQQLFVSLGARTSISNDISTHQYPLDDYAKHNFVFGLRASINYTFRDF